MNIETRIAQLKAWDHAYYNQQPEVENAVYDAFRDATKKLCPFHPYFSTVGAKPVSEWSKIRHLVPMRSLEKVNTAEEMRKWYAAVGSPQAILMDKFDGISISLRYERGDLIQAVTRGDDEVGEDITPNVRKILGERRRNGSLTGTKRGEIVLRKSVFEEYFKREGYKNCRNAAGGAAKDLTGEKCHLLDIYCYDLFVDEDPFATKHEELLALKASGFKIPRYWIVRSAEDIEAVYQKDIDGNRAALDYDIDGLVIAIDDNDLRESFGEKNSRPEGARAFKFPNDTAETTIRSEPWQLGASGRFTPVAYFDTVKLAGADVSQATLHNASNIRRIARMAADRDYLVEGDVVLVSRRNDVIPQVEALILPGSGKPLLPPETCSVCAVKTQMEGEYLICPNLDCPGQVAGSLKRWIQKLEVKDFGDDLIETLCEVGVREPAHLYYLREDHVANLRRASGNRVGESNARTALTNLHAKKNLPLYVLVGSLGIPLWSRSMCKTIVKAGYNTLAKMRAVDAPHLAAVDGVGPVKAEAFVSGFERVYPKIENLLAAGITIAPEIEGRLKGMSVCMTGFRSAEMKEAIEKAGGSVEASVKKNLTYLVAKDPNKTSEKLEKARKNGTKIISVDEMRKVLNG